jgi:hypothetical protein
MEQEAMDKITLDKMYIRTLKGLNAAVMFDDPRINFSDFSAKLMEKHPNIQATVCISPGVFKNLNYRAIDPDINTRILFAEPMGGGGHPLASGSPLSAEKINKIIDIVLEPLMDGQPS